MEEIKTIQEKETRLKPHELDGELLQAIIQKIEMLLTKDEFGLDLKFPSTIWCDKTETFFDTQPEILTVETYCIDRKINALLE